MSDSADQIMLGVRHYLLEAGIKQGQLFADTAYVMNSNTKFELRGVRLILFDSTGAVSATLTSKEATYSTVERRMEARGDVVVTTTDGKRLDTQQLIFDQQQNQVKSDSAFVLLEQTRKAQGASFTSDAKFTNMTCVLCSYTAITPPPADGGTAIPPASGTTIPPKPDTTSAQATKAGLPTVRGGVR